MNHKENIKKPLPIYAPNHYSHGGIEMIDILRAKLSPEQFEGFLLGNVIKYLFRYPHKGTPSRDLDKAAKYLEWLRILYPMDKSDDKGQASK